MSKTLKMIQNGLYESS